ncbi:uncharacterized protein CANTADRAFT_229186 [Suhomyces tanzawaensis NRRL Y-17324]|uniref:Uncharacterized protein n=1 Tax=Suhomyces tanzawaensis NRRL Y-17324 TaxID=984487 RepID=A0A1E4SL05_9ASCO|nr:uncharacterized protein CANTADRAFT_229186 [Suhomyces tanzawaensis NRRL Y-17324]ODV80168.1 hypothetical protein CANTADRAFT_229186 [Suhomyces tanzawaensis NRRL Y-17324]
MSRVLHQVLLLDLELDRKRFYGKDEIKPWLQECLSKERNIHIVIERLDTSKIIFKCKNNVKKEITKPSNTKSQVRRHTTCPFKIRANYSLKNKYWSLVVINDSHDHLIEDHRSKPSAGASGKSETAPISSGLGDASYSRVDDMFNPSPEEPPQMGIPSTSNNTSASDVFSNLMGSTGSITSVALSDTTTPKKDKDMTEYTTQQSYFAPSPDNRKRGMAVSFGNRQPQASKTSIRAITDDEVRKITESRSADDVALFLRKETNRLVNLAILNNANLSKREKTSLLDSVSSQFILDHKDHLSEKFIELLQQNRLKRKDETVEDQRKRQRNKQLLVDQSRILPSQKQYQQRKSILNSWLTTPTLNSNGLTTNPTTNLIPLSPLLNDSDNEYSGAGANNGGLGGNSFDGLTQIPSNATFTNPANGNNIMGNGVMIPNQVLQIQNQTQQLPSFNSIQNQLPLSPGNTALSLFGSNISGNSLIPPISNGNNNTTLNPSHLLKGSGTKNALLSLNQSTSNLLADSKLGGSFPLSSTNELLNIKSRNDTNSATNTTTSNLNNVLSSSSDPTSQQLNQLNASSFFSGMNSNVNTINNFQGTASGQTIGNSNPNVSANLLNHMGNFNDPGW